MRLRCKLRKATESNPLQTVSNGMAVARKTVKQLLLSVLLVSNLAFSESAIRDEAVVSYSKLYNINLPAQSVADSLASLSEQLDILLLFPYQTASNLQANPVKGRFTLPQTLALVLKDTGFSGRLTQKGVLMISLTESDGTNHKGRVKERTAMNINDKTKKTLLASMIGLFAAGGVATAVGQDSGESARAQGVLDEIIVTAQKREQSLQDTALAISALSASALEARGISSGYDLQFSVPGLTMGESNIGPAQVTLRGVGMENIFLGGDPGVPVHIDGHYIQDTRYILQDFMDVERVEVLRGPQGTLYGRNAMGGSINVITKKPGDEFEASVGLDLGNYNKVGVEAVLSGPITDNLGGRLVVSDKSRDGYINNLSPIGGQDLKNADYTSVRGTVVYDFSDDLSVTVGGYYYDDSGNTVVPQTFTPLPTAVLPGFVNYYVLNNPEPNPTPSDARQVRFNGFQDDSVSRASGGSIDFDWSLDTVSVRSLTSYNRSNDLVPNDADGSDAVTFHDIARRFHEVFSQEFQLLSSPESDSSWILGLFYYSEQSTASETFDIDNWFVVGAPKSVLVTGSDLESTAIGVFGQIEYPLSDQLSIVGGLRYNQDEKDFIASQLIPDLGLVEPDGSPQALSQSDEWEEMTFKLGVNYALNDDMLLYGSYSTGYKAGGFNGFDPSYDPETVEALEFGLKGSWMDRTVVGNLSVFHYDYSDKQEFKRDPIGFAIITNAGAATIWGVELEGVVRPASALTIDTSIAYLNAEYDTFDTADNINPAAGVLDLSGNQLPRSPEWKLHLGIQYDWFVESGMVSARVDASWVDDQYSSAFNRDSRDLMESYQRANAQLNWESSDSEWLASLYIHNIENKDTIANLFDSGPIVGLPVPAYAHYLAPRTYGVKVTRNF